MGKYSVRLQRISITTNASAAALEFIANELAEKNRLERYKINNGCYDMVPDHKLEDEV